MRCVTGEQQPAAPFFRFPTGLALAGCAEPHALLSNHPPANLFGRARVPHIASIIATELTVHDGQIQTAIDLLDGGATVPFISRYRKNSTAMPDDIHLRAREGRLRSLRDMEE